MNNCTNTIEMYEIKDRSCLDVYSQRLKKTQKPSWCSGGFIYSVTPCLKALDHPSHDNADAII